MLGQITGACSAHNCEGVCLMRVRKHKVGVSSAIAFFGLLTILFLQSSLRAQSFYGSVLGTVVDTSGAVVPDAAITVTNVGTNEKQTVQSDAGGKFTFANLVPATYNVEVTKASFKRFVREQIAVQVGSVVRVDAELSIGSVSETVEVTSQTALLQTDTSSSNTTIAGTQVQEMPLNGRNVMNLIALAPGVVPTGSSQGSTGLDQNSGRTAGGVGWGNYQIGGGIQGTAAQYIDGVSNNLLGGAQGGNQIGLVPTQDAIQEFNVASSNAGADFGRFAGGVVNMATKSGTNAFHGSLYEYFRNADLNANDFFSNQHGTPRSQWNQNQYGVSAAGPVRKDKVFFMFTWEGLSVHTAAVNATNVPTQAMQNGVFTNAITDPLGNCNIVRNPAAGTWTITNLYQGNCGDPVNKILKTYFPLPNSTGATNWFSTYPVSNAQNQYNGRVDYTISPKQRLFGRYTHWSVQDHFGWKFNQMNPGPSGSPWQGPGGNGPGFFVHQFVLGDTFTINSTTVLDVRVNFVREYAPNNPTATNVDESQFGSSYAALASQMSLHTLPAYSVSGGLHSLFNMASFQGYYYNYMDNYGNNANLVKIRGSHTFKFGAELRLMDDSADSNTALLAGEPIYGTTYTGDEFASFLMGYPTSAAFTTEAPSAAYSYYQAYYAMDTWQAKRNLTLNLGLRYELPGAVAERDNRAIVLLPDAVDPNTGIKGTLSLVDSPLYRGRTTVVPKYNLFAPRVGFAFRAAPSTVIRGGYGISYLPNDITPGVMPFNSIDNTATTQVNVTGTLPTPLQAILQSFVASGLNQPFARSVPNFMTRYGSQTNYLAQAIAGPVPYQSYPYTQQWNFAVSHQFKGDWMAEIGYTGLHGANLPGIGTRNLDELSSQYYSMGSALLSAATSCPNAPGLVGSKSFTVGQCLRPYPQYNNVQDTAQFYAWQNYNSMQVKTEKRFGAAGVLTANYTWSKNLANTDVQAINTFAEGNGEGPIQDYNNLAGEYSLISYDVTRRFVASYVLKLPFGKGQKFGQSLGGAAGALVSGWAVNGITNFQSGFPLAITTATKNKLQTSFGAGTTRPNAVAGCQKVIDSSGLARVNAGAWFNTSCFQYAGDYAFGNESRVDSQLRADGIKNFDFALQKATTLHESIRLEFRAEFFNIFNRVQFAAPVTTLGSTTFGQILTQSNKPRQIQFSLRLNY
jgi:hypothetical protein